MFDVTPDGRRSTASYPTFSVPVIDGWMLQCQPTVEARSTTIVCVSPGGRLVLELPSSSVNVCCVSSLFVTVSVTLPAPTSTELGENVKFCAVIVALEAPPPVDAGVVAVLVVVVDEDDVLELELVQAAVTKATAAIAKTIP